MARGSNSIAARIKRVAAAAKPAWRQRRVSACKRQSASIGRHHVIGGVNQSSVSYVNGGSKQRHQHRFIA